MVIITDNMRCRTFEENDCIIKEYKGSSNFHNEKSTYERLKGRKYLTDIINIDDKSMRIVMKKIKNPTLTDYANKHNKLPSNLANQIKFILLDMAENGIVNVADICKYSEHIFIDELTEEIMIIDFDINIVIDFDDNEFKNIIDREKTLIENNYKFVSDDDEYSLNDFIDNLKTSGFTQKVINNFENSMEQ